MTDNNFKKYGEEEEQLYSEGELTIPLTKDVSFIDYLFNFIIPREKDIQYPTKAEWSKLTKNVMAGI